MMKRRGCIILTRGIGINIDSPVYIRLLPNEVHTRVHSKGYNKLWEEFIESGETLSYNDI